MNKNTLKVEYDLDTKNTIIYLRDEAVGLIQDFEFRASVDNQLPQIEFTFPDLREYKGCARYIEDVANLEIKLRALKHIGHNIKIKFVPLYSVATSKTEVISEKEFSSSTPIEDIDLSKFDQPELKNSDIPA